MSRITDTQKRLAWISLFMAMCRDAWMGKITWEHFVTTLRFSANQLYQENGPIEDPYIPRAPEGPSDTDRGGEIHGN